MSTDDRRSTSYVRWLERSSHPVVRADCGLGGLGVLAGDLVGHVRRRVAELLLDVLRRLRPHTVAVPGPRRRRSEPRISALPSLRHHRGLSRTSSYGAEYG